MIHSLQYLTNPSSLPVPAGSNKVLMLIYAHHSQSEVIIITPFYLLIAQSERAVCLLQIYSSSLRSQSKKVPEPGLCLAFKRL